MIKITGLEKRLSADFCIRIDDLTVEDGERVAVIGPNGSGKSTLLRLLAGIIKPDKGVIEIGCESGRTGYEPQAAYAFKGTVTDNVRLGLHGKADIENILRGCRLYELKDKRVSSLSGGEKQRMCLARMAAGNFGLLLLDEPMSAVDIELSAELEKYLVELCEKNGTTLLMSTHLPSQALSTATKVLIMNNGSVSEYSDISELNAPKSEFGKKFIGQWRIG